ncbi:MAG: hypothetical protein ACI31S_05790 [Bacilli bacterium]
MKCLEVIFIRVKIKGYLKNISSNEVLEFNEKGIKNNNKITYTSDNVKNIIKINNNKIFLIRESDDFLNTFVFDKGKSVSNYLLKENGYSLDLDVVTLYIDICEYSIFIKYKIVDTNNDYEFKIEMSEML